MVKALPFIAVGIFSTAWLPALPPLVFLIGLMVLGVLSLILFWHYQHRLKSYQQLFIKILLCLLFGFIYGVSYGHKIVSEQLPELFDKSDFLVTGQIVGIPVSDSKKTRFHLKVTDVAANKHQWLQGKTLRLGWYGHQRLSLAERFAPGERWQLSVRLRRPRGFVNPGGFDYQAWLIRQGIAATGYVRTSDSNRHLSGGSVGFLAIDLWRWRLRNIIADQPVSATARGLITALTIGDSTQLSQSVWASFSRNGIIHLLVISGLHIGLSALFGYWLGFIVARCAGLFLGGISSHSWACLCSLIISSLYAMLSGMGLPAQRALVMIAVVNTVLLLSRYVQPGAGFWVALLVIALVDPLAVHSAGFWLSFGAVAVLLWFIPNDRPQSVKGSVGGHVGGHAIGKIVQLFGIQWLLFISFTGLLIIWQLPQSLFSPLINFIAIPWVSLFIVPLCLIAAVFYPVLPVLAEEIWQLIAWQLDLLITLMALIPEWQMPVWISSKTQLSALLLVSALLILPKGIPLRSLGCVLLAATMTSSMLGQSRPPLVITVLDVGQGLAVVVETPRHTLVYDSGPFFSENFNAGSGVVVPYLKQSGRNLIDLMMISHGDSDHAGGVGGILEHYQPVEILSGEPLTHLPTGGFKQCSQGMSWRWDDVDFNVLSPSRPLSPAKLLSPATDGAVTSGNDQSCVLLINFRGQKIVLPGDIGTAVENRLIAASSDALEKVMLLVAPHHGSKTSSGWQFLSQLKPSYVVFSAGYNHHFGHPSPVVMDRYKRIGTSQLLTPDSGAVTFRWDEDGELTISEARRTKRRYWY